MGVPCQVADLFPWKHECRECQYWAKNYSNLSVRRDKTNVGAQNDGIRADDMGQKGSNNSR